jgi:hypothetical protein
VPHQQAGHMTAPDQCCINVKKLLSIRRRPHMTLGGHRRARGPQTGPKRTLTETPTDCCRTSRRPNDSTLTGAGRPLHCGTFTPSMSALGQLRRIDTAPGVAACPLRPSKRTLRARLDMCVKCQSRLHALQQSYSITSWAWAAYVHRR